MNRRLFIQIGAVGAAYAVASAHGATAGRSALPFRRRSFQIEEATIAQMQAAFGAKQETAVSLVREYLERIEKIDRNGPRLKAVIELNPDALSIARERDRERKENRLRGRLHGIPILLKDNIGTHDAMTTTAGSLALAGSIPPKDAFVVRQLRAAGAVILGKTNLSEWANFRSNRSSSGWSGRGGQTRNPYVLDRNPSGSSSGSAVSVAANLCAAAVGTETDGSIVSPSSFNGIVGIKPTLGLVSRSGIIPIAHSQDTAGPMARTVADAALLLGSMACIDPDDAPTNKSRGKAHLDYTQFLDPNGLRGARIGVARQYFRLIPEANRVIESAIEQMKAAGATVIDPADIPSHGKIGGAEYQVLLYEFKAGLNRYLQGLGDDAPVRSLAEIIEFNERNREKEMPFFGQEILIQAQEKGPLDEPAYLEALEKCGRLSRDEGIDAVMNEHRLDALVAPTTGPAHKIDLVYGDRGTGGSSSPAAVAGYPSITLPAGYVFGLPVGISFFGRAFTEPTLLKLAFAFEQATQVRHVPKFLETIG